MLPAQSAVRRVRLEFQRVGLTTTSIALRPSILTVPGTLSFLASMTATSVGRYGRASARSVSVVQS